MISWFLLVLRALSVVARSRVFLSVENAILRHQLGETNEPGEWPMPFWSETVRQVLTT